MNVVHPCAMTSGQRREQYTLMLMRAFNGAITVDGQRIVAHPSGLLIARTPTEPIARGSVIDLRVDADNDWSDV